VLTSFSHFGFWNCVDAYLLFFIPFKTLANILISFLDSRCLCASWEFNCEKAYVFNDSFLITFTSDDEERRYGFVLSYVERKYNTTEEQTSMTTTHPATDVQTYRQTRPLVWQPQEWRRHQIPFQCRKHLQFTRQLLWRLHQQQLWQIRQLIYTIFVYIYFVT
jgi:hypothetical protein